MKITLRQLAPRNPLVGPSRMRHAGVHARSTAGIRQKNARELRRELERLGAKEKPPHR
ncbi:MAG TPA: hypothetical protein VFQ16_01475 [Burkholderiaceae bacterium]|nr:hypothetical protein [Burkholderiaceae bacterium]